MNRVYKVIWSKAKHCYVVTSEIAKSHTKGESTGRGLKKLAAALLVAAALMGPNFAWAADTVSVEQAPATAVGSATAVEVYTKEGADKALYDETAARIGADAKLVEAVNSGITLNNENVLQKTTIVNDDGKVTTDRVDVTEMILNKGKDNQITLSEDGIKVGKNSTTMDEKGIYAGSDYDYGTAKAALDATEGKIKGANGKFTVDANGQVTANGGVDTNSGDILTRGGKINAGSGDISGKDITGSGTVTGHAVTDGTARMEGGALTGVTTITATGNISTGGDVVSTGGKVQGTSISDGTATLSGGSLTDAVNITASGTITGNNVVVNEKLTTKNLEVTDGLKTDHITLGDETLNQTDINKGNVTSKVNETVGTVEYTAESIFNKDGSSITARTDEGAVDSTGKSNVGAKEISQYLGNNAVPGSSDKNVTRNMVRNGDGTFSMEDKAVDGTKSSTVSQNAGERKVTVTDGTKTLTVTENLTDGIVSETDDGAGQKVTLTQGMDGTYKVETSGTSTEEIGGQKVENYKGGLATEITGSESHHVTENQTITVDGTLEETVTGKVTENYKDDLETTVDKNEVHHVKGNQENTVGGALNETVTGKVVEDYKDDMSTKVGGNQAIEVTGNQENTVGGTLTETVTGKVVEDYKDDMSTKVGGNQAIEVTGDQSNTVGGALNETVTGKVVEDYKDDMSTKVGGNQSIEVTGNQENTVDGTLTETVKGNVTEDYKANLSTKVGGNQATEVTGDSSLSAKNISNTAEDGTITNTAQTVKTITGKNTVTSDTKGTTFENTGANAAVEEGDEHGSRINTRIFGNQVETGKVLTDFADVNNNLTVGGNTTLGRDGNTSLTVNSKSEFKDTVKMDSTLEVDGTSTFNDKVTITKNGLDVTGGTTTDTLEVKGTSEFGGKAAFKDDVSMGKNLTVTGKTETGTLHVNGDGYVGGDLNVEGNIETHDAELSENSRQVVTGRQLYQTNVRVDKLDNRIKKVGANAAALAALRPGDFNPDDKFSIAAGFGTYRNASAAAIGLFYRPNENVLLSLGTSFGDGENMVNAGVSVKFGRGKSMAERRKEMADEVSSMRDEMRSQNERIAELEEMLRKQSELIEKLSKEES